MLVQVTLWSTNYVTLASTGIRQKTDSPVYRSVLLLSPHLSPLSPVANGQPWDQSGINRKDSFRLSLSRNKSKVKLQRGKERGHFRLDSGHYGHMGEEVIELSTQK
ncbi:hypothetical protein PoB_003651200 [Plakobranchus ocellatus]|uniref:Uncharacterized protein n=1 Tax=Plakobranchus ocellatus TaxID=259542 RepID=A0AAV4ASY0_9GAST|nr:hypothetical protein PoB_003651200 [Plakobranchus ocellatus]